MDPAVVLDTSGIYRVVKIDDVLKKPGSFFIPGAIEEEMRGMIRKASIKPDYPTPTYLEGEDYRDICELVDNLVEDRSECEKRIISRLLFEAHTDNLRVDFGKRKGGTKGLINYFQNLGRNCGFLDILGLYGLEMNINNGSQGQARAEIYKPKREGAAFGYYYSFEDTSELNKNLNTHPTNHDYDLVARACHAEKILDAIRKNGNVISLRTDDQVWKLANLTPKKLAYRVANIYVQDKAIPLGDKDYERMEIMAYDKARQEIETAGCANSEVLSVIGDIADEVRKLLMQYQCDGKEVTDHNLKADASVIYLAREMYSHRPEFDGVVVASKDKDTYYLALLCNAVCPSQHPENPARIRRIGYVRSHEKLMEVMAGD